jgi:hypothetical protein
MKSILKTALVGLLLVAGTTKPVATVNDIKNSLVGILPESPSTDTTINHCLGGANSVFWACAYINQKLAAHTNTQNCTSYYFDYLLPSIKVISEDYANNTQIKLIIIRENNAVVAGLKITFTNNKNTVTEYLDAATTNDLLTKPSIPAKWGALYSAINYPAHFASTVYWTVGALAVAGVLGTWAWTTSAENAALRATLSKPEIAALLANLAKTK